MIKKLFILLFASSLLFADASAQKGDHIRPSSFGVSFSLTDYTTAQRIRNTSLATVINRDQKAKFSEMSPGLAVSYFKGLRDHIDFASTLNGTFVSVPIEGQTQSSNDQFLLEADASVNLKLFSDKYIFTPYLSTGVGVSTYNGEFGAFLPLGGGLKVNLFDEAAIFVNSQYRVPVITETGNYHFFHSVGIAGVIGNKKEPVKIIEPPLPIDTDGDGITDNVDKCPTVKGTLKYEGCPIPDTDRDGINDEEDKCKDVPGIAKYEGCPIPDTDRDGINDEADKCKDVPGIAKYEGCPIPDTDGDGINDEEDRCPQLPGVAANGGCPEIKQEVIQKVNYAATNIYFATGSAKLLSKSFAGLNEVVKIMQADANLKLSIEGHTDDVGKDESNQTLSENRANSVKTYLTGKGIDESRLTAAGFGETMPVADNKTAAGRSKNRRVVMKADY